MENIQLRKLDNLIHKLESERNQVYSEQLAEQIINEICEIHALEDATLIYGCARCISQTLAVHSVNEKQLKQLISWFEHILNSDVRWDTTLLTAFTTLLTEQIHNECDLSLQLSPFIANQLLLHHLQAAIANKSNDLIVANMQIFDAILSQLLADKCVVSENMQSGLVALTKLLLNMHYNLQPPCNDATYAVVFALSSLRVLCRVCTLSADVVSAHIAELFGLAKAYFLYGLTACTTVVPQKVLPSQQVVALDAAEEAAAVTAAKGAQAHKSGGRVNKTRKPKVKQCNITGHSCEPNEHDELLKLLEQNLSDLKTSDSELSGTEQFAATNQQQRRITAKVRLAAIGLLSAIVCAQDRHQIYGYWHILFPTQTQIGDSNDNAQRNDLMYISQHDPNVRCRIAALQVTTRLLYNAKSLLGQAEIGNSNNNQQYATTSFMPFSQHLGLLLLATYESLANILAKEASYAVLTQALKSLAMLVQATHFKRIKSNLVPQFMQHVRPLVYHRNAHVQLAALMVIEFLLSSTELTTEIAEAVGLEKYTVSTEQQLLEEEAEEQKVEFADEEEEETIEENANNHIPSTSTTVTTSPTLQHGKPSWLLSRVLCKIEIIVLQRHETNPLSVQCFKVLNAMATHFQLLLPQLKRLTAIFEALFSKHQYTTAHAARCFNSCAHHMNLWLSTQSDIVNHYEQIVVKCTHFWLRLLPAIQKLLSTLPTTNIPIGVLLIDGLSNIGAIVYHQLPPGTQIQLLSFLTQTGSETQSQQEQGLEMAAAAVRALAVYATYATLRGDLVFIENTAELGLVLAKKRSLLIRSKSYWALSSISDALVLQQTNNETNEVLSDNLLRRLMQAAIEGCQDNDKVNCSAARILGNLLSLLQAQQLQQDSWRHCLQAACDKLSYLCLINSAKTRWNACYAISTMWRNKLLFSAELLPYQLEIYKTLCTTIVKDSNFKVRINASSALQQITHRAHFGSYFELFWTALLTAIEQSYNLDNFYEYNHRDKLQEQLCLSICQLLRLAEPDDFPSIRQHLMERLEVVQNTWLRVVHRMVPEAAAPLMACPTIVLQKTTPQLSNTHTNAIEFVAQTFNTN